MYLKLTNLYNLYKYIKIHKWSLKSIYIIKILSKLF